MCRQINCLVRCYSTALRSYMQKCLEKLLLMEYLSALGPRLKATSLQDSRLYKVWGAHWSITLADHLLKGVVAEGHLELRSGLA